MASMANITVKLANGTTDRVWTALSAAQGDKTPAIWRDDTVTAVPVGLRPVYTMTSKSSANGAARLVDLLYVHPLLTLDTSKTPNRYTKVDEYRVKTQFAVPQNALPETLTLADLIAMSVNLSASTLVKTCVGEGYSAS